LAQAQGAQFQSVLISGNINKSSAIMASDLGICRLLEKPITKHQLLDAVRPLVASWEADRVRDEIRQLIVQMRELNEAFRMICERDYPGALSADLEDTGTSGH